MSNPLETPLVRYGMAASSAAILVIVAFAFLDGTMRLLVLGMAVLEIAVVPQILKRAAEQQQ
ncbi:hypothetical protein [Halorussus marinus]|uniref:hypothetical protein n=1 Tax=Halorussus marinus TaxID=2505976 RepID=UPI00106ED046|nr:hypothetical protein [Halorussus marinus]